MSDYMIDGDTVTRTVTEAVPASEIEQRLAFWTDELERIEADYLARKTEAEKQIAALTPVVVEVERITLEAVEPVKR